MWKLCDRHGQKRKKIIFFVTEMDRIQRGGFGFGKRQTTSDTPQLMVGVLDVSFQRVSVRLFPSRRTE